MKNLEEKKNKVAEKMTRIELGSKAKRNFAYRIEDHNGRLLKEGGSKKGRESLNPPHKGRDNEVMESRNEKELN